MRPGRRDDEVLADAEQVSDLDAPDPDAGPPSPAHGWWGSSRPSGSSGWRGRAGAAALVVAAVLGASVGSVVTARHERSVDRDRQGVLALQAGPPRFVSATDPGSTDVAGRELVTLSVPITNRGAEAATVSVLGLDAPGQVSDGRPPTVVVPDGGSAPALLRLDVPCADHPPVSEAALSREPTTVRVRVELPSGPRETALSMIEVQQLTAEALLTSACRPASERVAPQQTSWVPQADGSVVVTVDNVDATTPLTVALQQTPGLGVTGAEPLPATIPAGEVGEVALLAAPRCAAVVRTPGAPPSADLDLVTVVEGVQQARLGDTGDGKVRWLTRALTLACG